MFSSYIFPVLQGHLPFHKNNLIVGNLACFQFKHVKTNSFSFKLTQV